MKRFLNKKGGKRPSKSKKELNGSKLENSSDDLNDAEQSLRAVTKSGEQLYVGDKILLANKKKGKVTSLGPKPDKQGIWVRVLMDAVMSGNADDMYSSNNKSTKSKAIWVPIQRVDRVISRGNKFNLTIDDRVIERKKNVPGVIKYVGPTHFDKGVWFGVALDEAKGKNNGTVRKKFYFLTDTNHGVMLPYRRLELETPSAKKARKKRSQTLEEKGSGSPSSTLSNGQKHRSSNSENGPIIMQSHAASSDTIL